MTLQWRFLCAKNLQRKYRHATKVLYFFWTKIESDIRLHRDLLFGCSILTGVFVFEMSLLMLLGDIGFLISSVYNNDISEH